MPTTDQKVVGDAPADYAKLSAWITATNGLAVANDTIYEALMKTQEHTEVGDMVAISGVGTDAARYRVVRQQDGARTSFLSGVGARLKYRVSTQENHSKIRDCEIDTAALND